MPGGSERYDSNVDACRSMADVGSADSYRELYERALKAPEAFWAEQAQRLLSWDKQWDNVVRSDFDEGIIQWFEGGILNASYNCLDRHLERLRNNPAFVWVGDDGEKSGEVITYGELYEKVNGLAALLKAKGVGRGDRVVIHMPMVPELPTAMLACARIGAVHCVVYSGFGEEALAYRIQDCGARVVITSDGAFVDGKAVPMKAKVDAVAPQCSSIETVLVLRRTGRPVQLSAGRDLWLHEALEDPLLPSYVPPEPMAAEDMLFILYTSGPTGKPKGIVHTHGGYLVYAATTAGSVFDIKEQDTIWVADDIGWICGHTYSVYGPLLKGACPVLYEGRIGTRGDRMWSIVEQFKVDRLFTLPATIQLIAANDPDSTDRYDLSCLKTVGFIEQIVTQDTWTWMFQRVAKQRCPVVNAYGQTETGGIVIASFPAAGSMKPGACSVPLFGVKPIILDPGTGEEVLYPNQEGVLCIERPWPGMARTIFGDHDRFIEGVFSRVPGVFFTGDGAKQDDDKDYWILGRIDDVINTGGRRVGIPELESVLISHQSVTEAAVVGFPHPIKGVGVYAFVHLADPALGSEEVKAELKDLVKRTIGDFAAIDLIQWVETLPKTPSGKILRVILQNIAAGQVGRLREFASIADPEVVRSLVKGRMELEKH